MSTITFGGLNSGLDTDTIIESLVGVKEQQLITPLQTRVSNITTRQTALSGFQTLLSNLKSAASSLKTAAITGRTASSASATKLSIDSTASTAVAGTYDVTITTIATNDRVYFDGEADTSTTTFGTGTVSITSNSITKEVVIDSTNNTLQGIVDAINATSGMDVTASIVNDGGANPYRLVLTSKSTGTTSNITENLSTTLSGLAVDAATTASNNAVNASITVNSLTISKSTNTFSDAIPGVTFTVKDKETTTPIKVTVTDDYSSTTSSINTFVSAYNTLASAYDAQFAYNSDTESVGILGADYTLHSTETKIKNIIFDIYDDLSLNTYDSLNAIGITVDKTGTMSVDSTKLNTALTNNSTEVKKLFQGTTDKTDDGLFEKLYNTIDIMVNTTSGTLVKKSEIYDDQIEFLNELIDDRETRIANYEQSLMDKFVYLEEVLTSLKSMEKTIENFSEQLSSLNS